MALNDPIPPRDQKVPSVSSDEMTFGDVASVVRAKWWLPAVTTLAFLAAALAYDFLATPIYEADALLAPAAETQGAGALSSMAGELSGLASLAGLSLSSLSGNQAQTQIAIATLQSRALIEQYVKNNRLLPVLFANRWNSKRKAWKSVTKSKQPTLWDAGELFRKEIESVDYDRLSGLVTVTVKWKSAKLAASWANGLVELTDARLRKLAITETERNIEYLEKKQKVTKDVDVSMAISRLLEQELDQEMLAQGNRQYAFTVVDPAVPPGRPEWPPRVVLALGGGFVGFLLGVLLAVLLGSGRGETVKRR